MIGWTPPKSNDFPCAPGKLPGPRLPPDTDTGGAISCDWQARARSPDHARKADLEQLN
jgi:hypothetical protein